jgi:ABC-type transporter MlaC component
MSYYHDQTVEFEPSINFKNKTNVSVRALIRDKGKPDIKIAFKVRKNKRTGEWLVLMWSTKTVHKQKLCFYAAISVAVGVI